MDTVTNGSRQCQYGHHGESSDELLIRKTTRGGKRDGRLETKIGKEGQCLRGNGDRAYGE